MKRFGCEIICPIVPGSGSWPDGADLAPGGLCAAVIPRPDNSVRTGPAGPPGAGKPAESFKQAVKASGKSHGRPGKHQPGLGMPAAVQVITQKEKD